MSGTTLRTRRSIQDIQNDFDTKKDTAQLENLMTAWEGIKALPPDNFNSFFVIGGYHGEPFRGQGETNPNYWGGYCNHGNVLFPTWHRAYMLRLENALRSIPGCQDVTLPYWDETDKYSTTNGIPSCLTDELFTYSDGRQINNPIRSFVFPETIQDTVEDNQYTKAAGYETVRYPLSGLVGTPADQAATAKHNSQYYIPGTQKIDYSKTTPLLNGNVMGWLNGTEVLPGSGGQPIGKSDGIVAQFQDCLSAPNYTVFSNTTSAGAWNKDPATKANQIMPVEQPHNDVHLSVGGFDIPGQGDLSPIADANGDMGENETAGLDPIFFFHHCNVDRVFWSWQVKNGYKDSFDIIQGYAGTNNEGGQPPVGYEPDTPLTMESPLYPYKITENGIERDYQSKDVVNIETQLGVTYEHLYTGASAGTATTTAMATEETTQPEPAPQSHKTLLVSGINRGKINGSFVITAYATVNGQKHYLGHHSVLSRWRVNACKNCQNHLEVSATFSLGRFSEDELKEATYDVQISGRASNEEHFATFAAAAEGAEKPYKIEVI